MSATVEVGQQASPNERRTRKTHAKVKTGCTTCKIRRKKCDETKPSCLRCVNTGRTCDGYASPAATTAATSYTSLPPPLFTRFACQRQVCQVFDCSEECTKHEPITKFVPYLSKSVCRTPSTLVFTHDIDYHCFDFFRLNTGPQFQGYFDSSLWRQSILRAAVLHPVVLKAAAAVGAVHQRFNHGISREAFEYCAIADRIYQDAKDSLDTFREEESFNSNFNEIITITTMLFAVFESFQGNLEQGVNQSYLALKNLWNRPLTVVHTESRYRNHEMRPGIFFDIFDTVREHATRLFGSPPNVLPSGEPLPTIPPVFDNQEQARDLIFTEVDRLLHTPATLWHDEPRRTRARNQHVSRFLKWSAAFAETVRTQPERSRRQRQAGHLLKAVRGTSYLVLFVIFFVGPNDPDPFADLNFNLSHFVATTPKQPTSLATTSPLPEPSLYLDLPQLWSLAATRPHLTTNLTRVCLLLESSLNESSPFFYDSHTISVDSGIGPPLSSEPTPHSSCKTRSIMNDSLRRSSRVTSLEGSDEDTDDLWRSIGVYAVAERLASVEEHAVLRAVQDFVGGDIKWIDITWLLEERRLLIRYCRPGEAGDGGVGGDRSRGGGLLWVQKWLKF